MINKKIILTLSLPAAFLIMSSGLISMIIPEFYYRESYNWQVQSIGQDIIDTFLITPLLITAAMLVRKDINIFYWIWAGLNIYLFYTYSIFCFSVHFNSLFIIYCIILGLSFYSILYFIYNCIHIKACSSEPLKLTGIYFIVISLLFYLLWLTDIIPFVVSKNVPQSLAETGLTTNPVHVIDLSVFLPGLFITGILLLKKNNIGYIVVMPLLIFTILMDITIAILTVIMFNKGLSVNIYVSIVMIILAFFSAILLIKSYRSVKFGIGL